MSTPPQLPTENRVYLSASNRFYLALKTFGYSLLGYFIIAVILVVFVFLGGGLAQLTR
jgi:hypothetical protein